MRDRPWRGFAHREAAALRHRPVFSYLRPFALFMRRDSAYSNSGLSKRMKPACSK
jgi:hypothetical protein